MTLIKLLRGLDGEGIFGQILPPVSSGLCAKSPLAARLPSAKEGLMANWSTKHGKQVGEVTPRREVRQAWIVGTRVRSWVPPTSPRQ